MGVEFRLGRQDGHNVEDFLARQPKGVTAITLSTPFLRHQVAAAEAAMALDADVLFEPLTERLVHPASSCGTSPTARVGCLARQSSVVTLTPGRDSSATSLAATRTQRR